jgi:hypothetical protein
MFVFDFNFYIVFAGGWRMDVEQRPKILWKDLPPILPCYGVILTLSKCSPVFIYPLSTNFTLPVLSAALRGFLRQVCIKGGGFLCT